MLLRRTISALLTLAVVLVVVFAALEALPGDACTAFLERDAYGEALANCRAGLGLDRPLVARFSDWAGGLVQGDLGHSLARRRPVLDVIGPRVRNTFVLTGTAAVIAVPSALLLGVLTAVWRDSPFDLVASSVTFVAMTVPEFVVATVLVFVFAITLQWLPAVSTVAVDAPLARLLPSIVLPVVVLSFVMIAHIMRVVRTGMIDALASEFAQAARLRGLSPARIVVSHALPSVLPPALGVTAMSLASLFGGVVIIERVFNYPGLGTLTLQAIHDRDLPVVQGAVTVFTATYIGLNLLADALAAIADPRTRTEPA